ncbi:hypothetical protein FKM82_005144 [Ascaphus truei]
MSQPTLTCCSGLHPRCLLGTTQLLRCAHDPTYTPSQLRNVSRGAACVSAMPTTSSTVKICMVSNINSSAQLSPSSRAMRLIKPL